MPDELTPLDRAVIALARNEPLKSIRPQGFIARLIFGNHYRPLANRRLEALRCYAILRRTKGNGLPQNEMGRLYEAGLDRRVIEQVDELILSTSAKRRPSPADSLHRTSTPTHAQPSFRFFDREMVLARS